MSHEQPPFKSRKFLAYLVAEVTWKAVLLVVLILGMKNGTVDIITGSIALAVVVVAGFIEAVYVGGQAAIDKYVQVAQIAASSGKSLIMPGMQVTHHPEAPKNPDPPVGG